MTIPLDVIYQIHYEVARNEFHNTKNLRAYRIRDGFMRTEFIHSERNSYGEKKFQVKILDDARDGWVVGFDYE